MPLMVIVMGAGAGVGVGEGEGVGLSARKEGPMAFTRTPAGARVRDRPLERASGPGYPLRMFDGAVPHPARKVAVTSLFLALILSVAGIPVAVAAPPVEKAADPLVLYHWWGSSSEMAALNALASVFKVKYPGVPEKR